MSIFTAKPNLKSPSRSSRSHPRPHRMRLNRIRRRKRRGKPHQQRRPHRLHQHPYMPFEYEENGKIVGIDADIANAIAKDLGAEAQLTSISFEGLDSGTGLTSGQCDIALGGISVTDERKSKMEFTDVYFEDNQAILVPKTLRSPPSKILRTPKSALSRQPAANPMPKKRRGRCAVRGQRTHVLGIEDRSGAGRLGKPLGYF